MALAVFSKGFQAILKNIQKFEIRHLSVKMTYMDVQVPFIYFYLFSSNGLQMASAELPRAFQMIFVLVTKLKLYINCMV